MQSQPSEKSTTAQPLGRPNSGSGPDFRDEGDANEGPATARPATPNQECPLVAAFDCTRHEGLEGRTLRPDNLAVEEPLEIRIAGVPIAVLMRSPGHDLELVHGFIVTEGIAKYSDLQRVAHCTEGEHPENVVHVTLKPHVEVDVARLARRLYTTSSCGICGKSSAKAALSLAPPFDRPASWSLYGTLVATTRLREAQHAFALCGGTHAAALINRAGKVALLREDIGRHNAVDKLVGQSLKSEINLSEHALLLSGRASFEMVQKALAARIQTVIALGAVSSLAAETARAANMNLVGFTSAQNCNVYSGELV